MSNSPAQDDWEGSSGSSTNSYTTAEITRLHTEFLGPAHNAWSQQTGSGLLGPEIRLVVEGASPDQAATVWLSHLGHVDSPSEPAAGGNPTPVVSYQRLMVSQLREEVAVTIQAGGLTPDDGQLLHCRLSFDPKANRVAITNMLDKRVGVMPKIPDGAFASDPWARRSITLEASHSHVLKTPPWALYTEPYRHILDFTILEHYPYDSTDGDKTTIIFLPAPPPPRLRALVAAKPTGSLDLTLSLPRPPPGDPLAHLGPGHVTTVVVPEGYPAAHGREVAYRRNCHVFSAPHSGFPDYHLFHPQHSKLPSCIKVVKLIRSGHLQPVSAGKTGWEMRRKAFMWALEVKDHKGRYEPVPVVRVLEQDCTTPFDLYMGHIRAPVLSWDPLRQDEHSRDCVLRTEDGERVLRDMADALEYVHGEGVVHNDIKPGNILYSRARGAVLVDFGHSTTLPELQLSVGGTPWYVPPELRGGSRGPPGDIFALGVVMLYVVRKLELPERGVYGQGWAIEAALEKESDAERAMLEWLEEVGKAACELGDTALETAIGDMVKKVEDRIQVDALVERVKNWQPAKTSEQIPSR